MELEVFAGQEKSELSMIEVARAILEERGRDHEMYFSDLVNEIQNYLEKSDAEIREALPHRYPMLLVDRVLEVSDDEIVAVKNVTINEPFFNGHFPEYPVMPGVLIMEALAQTAGVLELSKEENKGKLVFL